MPHKKITDRQIEAFKRFITRLPHGKDVDLVILKAHLLIEEEVNAILRARLRDPDVLLAEERFESIYRIRLAQSFFEPKYLPWLWHSLIQLNKLRNRVAHSIDPKGREHIMEDIVNSIPSAGGKDDRSPQDRFEFALWVLHEAVSSMVEPQTAALLELVPPPGAA
jgi:hypothetical protein